MWFDPITSWLVALACVAVPWAKEKTTKKIPAENWANKERMHKDRMNGMSEKQILRNVEQGRYYIPREVFQAYPEPHRDLGGSGKIIIENSELYHEDVLTYGAYEAQQWVKQGKYNLNEEELALEMLRIKRKYEYLYSIGDPNGEHARNLREIDEKLEKKKLDYKNTEAVRRWKFAAAAESKYHK